METLLQVQSIQKTYEAGTASFHALDDVSFTIEHGEFVGIMGPSGAGKSTLLNVLATIDTPTSGAIVVEGENIATMNEEALADFRRDHLGFIFQDYNLLDSLTVRENIVLPLAVSKTSHAVARQHVDTLAKRFGITSILDQYPYQISGGQKQRTAVCRALIANPKLIFADEPTGALDSKAAKDLLETLAGLNEAETTIMMVTHDAYAASFCRRVLYIQDGRLSNELIRGNATRDAFYQTILEELAKGGADDDAL